MADIVMCPVFLKECLKEKCTGYKTNTRQKFKDVKLNTYLSADRLEYYLHLSPDDLASRYVREVKIVRECKMLGKILEIEDLEDHEIPNLNMLGELSA